MINLEEATASDRQTASFSHVFSVQSPCSSPTKQSLKSEYKIKGALYKTILEVFCFIFSTFWTQYALGWLWNSCRDFAVSHVFYLLLFVVAVFLYVFLFVCHESNFWVKLLNVLGHWNYDFFWFVLLFQVICICYHSVDSFLVSSFMQSRTMCFTNSYHRERRKEGMWLKTRERRNKKTWLIMFVKNKFIALSWWCVTANPCSPTVLYHRSHTAQGANRSVTDSITGSCHQWLCHQWSCRCQMSLLYEYTS